jgi:uncharacterized membrane protein (DUF2068 family)
VSDQAPQPPPLHRRRTPLLVAIGAFRIFKALLLIIIGLAAAKVIRDPGVVGSFAQHVIERFKLDPDNEQIHALMAKVLNVPESKLRLLSIGSFVYAAGFAIEGAGLIGGWHWAEWLVVITTSLLLPYETYEMIHRASLLKAGVIALNILVVLYLLHRLRSDRRASRKQG